MTQTVSPRTSSAASSPLIASVFASVMLSGCAFDGDSDVVIDPDLAPAISPIPNAVLKNELIEPGETHFKNLWQLTAGGQNAEAYWSFADDRLSLQITDDGDGQCDRIYATGPDGTLRPISNGQGVTTCAFFMPGDREILYASTQSTHASCPKWNKPNTAKGEPYTWKIWPEYDIYVAGVSDTTERVLVSGYGYDAEATVSPRGDRIVFTSTRSGDLELWTCDLEGGDLTQVTDELGYDGGAFFSHDGRQLVFRSTVWTPEEEAAEQASYLEDFQRWQVKPGKMEIFTILPDGTGRKQVTSLGGANFAPYFSPDDQKIIFSSNHHNKPESKVLNFDLFLCDLDGNGKERVTHSAYFDAFPMFSHDGRFLAFSSNRGGTVAGETNVFIAEWVE